VENLNEILDKYKLPLALSLVGMVLIVGGTFSSGLFDNFSQASKKATALKSSDFPKESLVTNIKVDVSGAVNRPAVYSLQNNSRVEDALKLAGGFASSASASFIAKNLNLSAKLTDGQKLYIPFEGETVPGSTLGLSSGTAGKIGLNSASSGQLEDLPGVGPATATKIINARPFSEINELLTKKAVSRSVFEKIKDLIDLN
jgi:DNA uptake protein ComE-like DNA-binding protein